MNGDEKKKKRILRLFIVEKKTKKQLDKNPDRADLTQLASCYTPLTPEAAESSESGGDYQFRGKTTARRQRNINAYVTAGESGDDKH